MDSLEPKKPQAGSAREVLLAFLRLGVTSFGGPVAHIGYLRSEFVLRRQWLSERAYADLVALCQLGMARMLSPDRARAFIAIIALTFALLLRSPAAQIAVIVDGALLGLILCRGVPAAAGEAAAHARVSRRAGLVALTLFLLLLVGLPLLQRLVPAPGVALFAAFYRSGALVFGGGHVVLPLLRAAFVPPGWVSDG